jgi:hypothetical protein
VSGRLRSRFPTSSTWLERSCKVASSSDSASTGAPAQGCGGHRGRQCICVERFYIHYTDFPISFLPAFRTGEERLIYGLAVSSCTVRAKHSEEGKQSANWLPDVNWMVCRGKPPLAALMIQGRTCEALDAKHTLEAFKAASHFPARVQCRHTRSANLDTVCPETICAIHVPSRRVP